MEQLQAIRVRQAKIKRWLTQGGIVLLLVFLPLWVGPYILSIFIFIGIYSLVAMGLCLLLGYAGQISLGQNAFCGIGAYTSAILCVRYNLSPWLAIVCGATLSGVIAYILGKRILSLHGIVLALVTAAISLIFLDIFIKWKSMTGGFDGLGGIPRLSIGGFILDQDVHYYYLILIVVLLLFMIGQNVVKSRMGREMRAMNIGSGGSEVAAQSLGIDIAELKTFAFVLAAVYASIAGSIYAHYVTYINPEPFSIWMAILVLMMVVIGGESSLWGGIIGATVIISLRELVSHVIHIIAPNAPAGYETVIFGVTFLLVLVFLPGGLVSIPIKIRQLFLKKPVAGT